MKRNKLGNTNIYVSPVGFGVLTMGNSQLDLPLSKGAALIRYALERGINFFDTAQYYETYHYMKEGFKGIDMSTDNPDKPVICSKCLDGTYDGMDYAVKEALQQLDVNYIDIFLLHEVRSPEDYSWRDGALRCLLDYKDRGIIGSVGVSTHYVDVTEMMADKKDIDVVFPLINYAGLGIRSGDGAGTAEEMESAIRKCTDAGKGVFTMKAFGGGNLTKNYVKALEYSRNIGGAHSIMVGVGDFDQIDRLVEFAEGRLDPEYVPDVSKKKMYIEPGNCEACGACADACPNNCITIDGFMASIDHSKCITCGYCAYACPVRALILL